MNLGECTGRNQEGLTRAVVAPKLRLLSPFRPRFVSTNPGTRALNREARRKQKQNKRGALMRWRESFARKSVRVYGCVLMFAAMAAVMVFVSCGGGSSSTMGPQTANITVTLTDPPSCKFPNGAFEHVYVSVRSVQAHTSATADDNSAGWQELAPQLNTAPMQID